jgi:hypothetical protein
VTDGRARRATGERTFHRHISIDPFLRRSGPCHRRRVAASR